MRPIAALLRLIGRVGMAVGRRFIWLADRIVPAHGTSLADVKKLKPKFAVYFDVAIDGMYQIQMWLPHFEKLGQPFFIITRRPALAAEVHKLTNAPVINIGPTPDLEPIAQLKGLTTVLYVNNGNRNSEMARFLRLTHCQLMHGDSEKTASYNPVSGMYTKIFVAGQAGVERYARHGVAMARDKFVLVGRPQVAGVRPVSKDETAKLPSLVLYAPTWGGSATGEEYTSLIWGEEIVRGLIAKGVRVLFRPHPYSHRTPEGKHQIHQVHQILEQDRRASGREHIFGDAAEKTRTSFDCINEADAMVSDLSGIVSDWLYSLKPYLLVSVDETETEFRERYPLTAGGLVLDGREPERVSAAMDRLIAPDGLFDARLATREHYIAGSDAEDPGELFLKQTTAIILEQPILDLAK